MSHDPAVMAGLALVFIAAAALMLRRQVLEAEQGGELLPGLSLANMAEELTGGAASASGAPNADRNVSAFLAMIRRAEGTEGPNAYRTLFGHGLYYGVDGIPDTFDDFADHPRIAQQFTDKAGKKLWTTAAGAYQFLAVSPIPTGGRTRVDTWDRLQRRLQLPDFGPDSQDRAAIALIDEAGALADVQLGRFESAVTKCRRIWASLPGAGHNQPERTADYIRSAYVAAGGTFA